MSLAPGTRLGPYEIVAPIGAGGMGEVFSAHDTRLHRTVAIKVLPPGKMADAERNQRFLLEARATSALNHPNIVIVYDISSDRGTDFLVMEHVLGKTLKDLIPERGLSLSELVQYGTQIASGLGAAHTAGVIHRDVKPANIMITPEGHVKILDFGLAKLARPIDFAADDATRTLEGPVPGMIMGTVAYMSPEQMRGEYLDGRSDIFSLGCVLFHAATGRLPFRGPNMLAIMHEIVAGDPVAPSSARPELPSTFDRIIEKCLRKEPALRFQTMTDLAGELQVVATGYSRERIEVRVGVPSIAVLPFANMSAEPDNEHFGDGLAEELISALTGIGGLRVTARTSAFAFQGRDLDVREIGRNLRVGAVLEGSVRRSGNRLRITAQLVNVIDGYQLWSERYDREMTNVFDIQDEISKRIVEKLQPQLLGKESIADASFPARRHTADPEAYNLYLKGRYFWAKRPVGTNTAIGCFEKAIERDPNYALAYAGLADAYNTLGSWEAGILPPYEAFPKGRAYAEKALHLDPGLAEGHTALGYVLLHFAWDLPAAENAIREALRLNPRYGMAHHWYSHLLVAAGRMEESLTESLAYLNVDPAEPLSIVHLTWHYLLAGESDKALINCSQVFHEEPRFGWNHAFHSWALLDTGAFEQARQRAVQAVEQTSGAHVFLSSMAQVCAAVGERDEALRILDQLIGLSRTRYISQYEIGLIHEALGNTADAYRCWERAYEERSPWLVYLTREPRLKHLVGDPRFDRLLARVRGDLQIP